MEKKIFYTNKIGELLEIVELKDINEIDWYIDEIIEKEKDDYLLDILKEMKPNSKYFINMVYLGIMEIIEYLELKEEDFDLYKNYYIINQNY